MHPKKQEQYRGRIVIRSMSYVRVVEEFRKLGLAGPYASAKVRPFITHMHSNSP